MKDAAADEIRNDLKYEKIAFIEMYKDMLLSSDYVIDKMMQIEEIVEEILKILSLQIPIW